MVRRAVLLALVLALSAGAPAAGNGVASAEWPFYGRDLLNTRFQSNETALNRQSVAGLRSRWFYKTGRDVVATPIVANGTVFVGDMGGTFHAIDAATGEHRWTHRLRGPNINSAAFDDGYVYVGDNGGALWKLDARTGAVAWSVRPEQDPELRPFAQFWGAPVPFENRLYFGLAAEDDEITLSVGRKVWRGSVVAVDMSDGRTVWQTYTMPKQCAPGKPNGDRCTGASVWTTPAIDSERRLAYWGTGNAFADPAGDLSDAMIAVDVDTGAIEWSWQATANDSWSHTPEEICCDPDVDFGSSPVLFEIDGRAVVGEGQKNGWFHVRDRSTGEEIYSRHVAGGRSGPTAGGILASPAYAYGSIYAGATDPVLDAPVVNVMSRHFSMSAKDGSVRWWVPSPVWLWSAPAVANHLVFQGTTEGVLVALDADDGRLLWHSSPLGGIVASGPSIANGSVYVGVGCCGAANESGGVWAFGL